ncbi:MAG: T9SS type A sorting domain-containing protein, partial [Bacteroidota bacterium]
SGFSVSMSSSGTRVAIGAQQNDGTGSDAGHVRIYEENGGTWTQIGTDIDGEAAGDGAGFSVSLSGNGTRVVIGAWNNDDNGSNAGHVRIYEENGGAWTQVGTDIDGEAAGDLFGASVSISGDGKKIVVGGFRNDGNGTDAGHARIYEESGGVWAQFGPDIDGEATNDLCGSGVAISSDGTRVAIGANRHDGSASDAGQVRVYSLSAVLPVELVNFEGVLNKNEVFLFWQTSSERENQGFSVEYSHDAERWSIIGYVAGAGTSAEQQNYSFRHRQPIVGTTNYYRLRQIDYDGSFAYSDIQRVEVRKSAEKMMLYPNPTSTGEVSLSLPQAFQSSSIYLFTLEGEELKVFPQGTTLIDVSSLPVGTYLITVESGDRALQELLIVH